MKSFLSRAVFVLVVASAVLAISPQASANKGIDLYTWKDANGQVSYSILSAGQRPKELPEIMRSKTTSLKTVEVRLKNLREGTHVNWNDMVATTVTGSDKAKFVLPDEAAYNRIRSTAAKARLKLTIAQ